MSNNIKIKVSNDNGLGHVGIWFKDNNLEIIFPKNYTYNECDLYMDINLLSSCFEKYFLKLNQKSVSQNYFNDISIDGQKDFSFISLFNIINDYIENGYYCETVDCTQINGTGNINFTRTINKFSPYTINNNLIFTDHITNSKKINYNNDITEIHKYVVEKCFNIIGVFFPNIEHDVNCNLPFPIEYCINLLEKYISETFNDNKRLFFERLLSFFKISKTSESNIIFYSTNKFDFIWEEMLHELLCNEPIKDYYFNSSWKLVNSETLKINHPSRPDAIHIDFKDNLARCFIIDAKYYTYSLLNDYGTLPSTSDINKQILYKLHAQNVLKSKYLNVSYKYINLFILPKDSYNNHIDYLGHATSDFNSAEIVHAFSLDIKYVMNNYINIHRKFDFQNSILTSIYDSVIDK